MMKQFLAAAVTSAAMLMATGALADGGPAPAPPPPPPVYEAPPPPEYNWYTTVFVGISIPDDLKFDRTFGRNIVCDSWDSGCIFFRDFNHFDVPLNTGFLAGWTIGYDTPVSENWGFRPEVEVSWRRHSVDVNQFLSDRFRAIDNFHDFINTDNSVFSKNVSVLSLMFNGWFDWKLDNWTPYAGGGIGVGWGRLPRFPIADPNFNFVFFDPGWDAKSTAFAWQIGAGFNVDLSDNVFAGVGWRYFGADFSPNVDRRFFFDPFLDQSFFDGVRRVNYDYNFRTNEVLFNLGVRF